MLNNGIKYVSSVYPEQDITQSVRVENAIVLDGNVNSNEQFSLALFGVTFTANDNIASFEIDINDSFCVDKIEHPCVFVYVMVGVITEPPALTLPVMYKFPPTKKSFDMAAPPDTVNAPPFDIFNAFSVVFIAIPPDTIKAPDVLLLVGTDAFICVIPLAFIVNILLILNEPCEYVDK